MTEVDALRRRWPRFGRGRWAQIGSFGALAVISIVFLAPVIWMALTALKTQREALAQPPVWFFQPQWENFLRAWESNDFGRSFLVTTSVSIFSVILTMVLSIPAGYALARYRRAWLSAFEVGMMVIRMLPVLSMPRSLRRGHADRRLAGEHQERQRLLQVQPDLGAGV